MLEEFQKTLGKISKDLRESEKELIKLVVDLVRFESENPPVKDYEIQLFIRDFLREAGAKTELHDPGDNAWALTSSFGEGKDGLILYGHADVVPAGNPSKWIYPPFSGVIIGDRIYGRGTSDMKAGLAAELFVYKLLYQNDVKLPGKLEFVSVLDEENWHKTPIGWNTSDWLLSTGKLTGRACIMGEQSGIKKICIGERGDYWVKLTCFAQPRHGSAPVYDDNACVKLFRAIERIHDAIKDLKVEPPKEIKNVVYESPKHIAEDLKGTGVELSFDELLQILVKPTMNVGVFRGGEMINIVPDSCEAQIAFCVPLGMKRQELHEIVKSKIGDVSLELLGESQSDPSYTSPSAKIVQVLKQSAQSVLGETPALYVTQGTSDANVFRKHGIDTVFYGPGDFANTHAFNESVSIKAVTAIAQVYLKTVFEYFS